MNYELKKSVKYRHKKTKTYMVPMDNYEVHFYIFNQYEEVEHENL